MPSGTGQRWAPACAPGVRDLVPPQPARRQGAPQAAEESEAIRRAHGATRRGRRRDRAVCPGDRQRLHLAVRVLRPAPPRDAHQLRCGVPRDAPPAASGTAPSGSCSRIRTILTAGHCAHKRKGPWHGHAAYRSRYGPSARRAVHALHERASGPCSHHARGLGRATRRRGSTATNGRPSSRNRARSSTTWTCACPWRARTGSGAGGSRSRSLAGGAARPASGSGAPRCASTRLVGPRSRATAGVLSWPSPSDCPTCTPRRTPIGIVNAGNEADAGPRLQDGRPVNADLYFAKVSWALEDPDGWPCLDIHTGPTPSPTPTDSALGHAERAGGTVMTPMRGARSAVLAMALALVERPCYGRRGRQRRERPGHMLAPGPRRSRAPTRREPSAFGRGDADPRQRQILT